MTVAYRSTVDAAIAMALHEVSDLLIG